jgi:hypothetical protein
MRDNPEILMARRDLADKHQERMPPGASFDHGDGPCRPAIGHAEGFVEEGIAVGSAVFASRLGIDHPQEAANTQGSAGMKIGMAFRCPERQYTGWTVDTHGLASPGPDRAHAQSLAWSGPAPIQLGLRP